MMARNYTFYYFCCMLKLSKYDIKLIKPQQTNEIPRKKCYISQVDFYLCTEKPEWN